MKEEYVILETMDRKGEARYSGTSLQQKDYGDGNDEQRCSSGAHHRGASQSGPEMAMAVTGIVRLGRTDGKALDPLWQLSALSLTFGLAARSKEGPFILFKVVAAIWKTVRKGAGVQDPRAICSRPGVTGDVHLLMPHIRVVGVGFVGVAVAQQVFDSVVRLGLGILRTVRGAAV